MISSRDSPAEEIVAHDESGLLVPPGDAAALASAIARVLTCPDERRRLADGNRTRAAAMTWERSTAQLIHVYEQALERPVRSGPQRDA